MRLLNFAVRMLHQEAASAAAAAATATTNITKNSNRLVSLFEVGPRDGLQNISKIIPTDTKVELINRLSRCGFQRIEVTSFVNPKWIPQMADARQVVERIAREPGVSYVALTPNLHGVQSAIAGRLNEVAVFASATEEFSRHNINCSIAESLTRFAPVVREAAAHSLPVRGYVSCVVHCPYSGAVEPGRVAELCEKLVQLGVHEISLGDTIGAGTPETIQPMLAEVAKRVPLHMIALHCHDTNGRALDNIRAALRLGVRTFDASIAGLGGCPYAGGQAKGNVATERVLELFRAENFDCCVDLERVLQVSSWIKTVTQSHQS